ncbi:protein ALP1-like [Lolium perenne]|uniref:protein ALP1-like n=1 Tax=Lolium perenne TaxID=4522 RepID=UPI0021F50A51|nr:protein ALP1-like [Lolium perenne]
MSTSQSSDESDSDDGIESALMESRRRRRLRNAQVMYQVLEHSEKHLTKKKRVEPRCTGQQWVFDNLGSSKDCYDMFRMHRPCFDSLHDTLVQKYGLKGSNRMCSEEAVGMFLWTLGSPQSVTQVQNRFKRSRETINRKFAEVLYCVNQLAGDIIKPIDPQFPIVHERLRDSRFTPHFNGAIGAIDGTHIPVIVPAVDIVNHVGRLGYPTQNVMAVCDFDLRFTSIVAGWPGSVHDTRIFKDTLLKFEANFPHPPPGRYYLVDSGYPNQDGYLSPYTGTKYHLPEFRLAGPPSGKQEIFNHAHSSLRNAIERAFGVLKQKWRILHGISSYPIEKQTKIIIACLALHNFIRDSQLFDLHFYRCDIDENYMPPGHVSSTSGGNVGDNLGGDHVTMNNTRDNIANALFAASGGV